MFKRRLISQVFFGLIFSGLLADAQAQSVWTRQNSDELNGLHYVIWTGSTTAPQPGAKLIVLGRYTFTILTSPDGVSWTHRQTDNAGGAGSGYDGIAWLGNQVIALSWADSKILTSPDGVTWTTRFFAETDTVGFYPTGVATNGSLIVVVCLGGKAMSSPDGITWTERSTGIQTSFRSMVWTGTQFVAVGEYGALSTSPDGITWTPRSMETTKHLQAVLWTGTQLVAVGEAGTILTSPDAIHWTARNSGTANILNSVTWTGNQLVAVGSDPSLAVNNVILTSPDGVVWTGKSLGTTDLLEGVTWTGSQLVMVGQSGGIWTSPENLTPVGPNLEKARSPGLQWAGSRLLVTVPEFLKGGKVTVSIYGTAGEKRGEVSAQTSEKTVSIPTTALSNGAYFLEIRGPNGWRSWPFNVWR